MEQLLWVLSWAQPGFVHIQWPGGILSRKRGDRPADGWSREFCEIVLRSCRMLNGFQISSPIGGARGGRACDPRGFSNFSSSVKTHAFCIALCAWCAEWLDTWATVTSAAWLVNLKRECSRTKGKRFQ